MANISVNSPVPVYDGQPLTFRSPADCSAISGLIVHYHDGKVATSKAFQFADAHGNNVGDYDLFAADALVKVILDTDTSLAFVQNADTNAYLEGRFDEKAETATYTAAVSATWTASGDYFYQDIAVSGILATDNPVVDIVCGSDNAANKVYSENICKVFRITTSANKIRVWATEAISTAFPIQLKVVR